jgi:membrane peptidoglycan carboxypeptidase
VPSLALGVAELSPVELLRAYAIFANHGVQDDLTVIRGITLDNGTGYIHFVYNPKQVFDPAATDLLTDMLESVFLDGTAKVALDMGFDAPAAGKTGTTSHYRDSWFAGYTPQLTTVVWVGMDTDTAEAEPRASKPGKEKKPRVLLTGATSALPIWVRFMKNALAVQSPATFPISPYLDSLMIDLHTGELASGGCAADQTSMEKYMKSHEPKASSCEAKWPETGSETHAQ